MNETINKDVEGVLSVDIDKYIEWYKNECKQSEKAEWLHYEVRILSALSSQTNYHCKTYKNKIRAKKYSDRIKEKRSEKINECNSFSQATYSDTEWLIPTQRDWQMLDSIKEQNHHIKELNRRLSLAKETVEARKNVVLSTINELKAQDLNNLTCYNDCSIIPLEFFDKGRYEAYENHSYMGYCQEATMYRFMYDYAKIKALEYANSLLTNLNQDKEIPKSNLGLTQKQIALLSHILKQSNIIQFNKISQDYTIQVKFISNFFGINIVGRIQDNNIYKYWKSINKSTDPENVNNNKNRKIVNEYLKANYSLEL